jgi:hypothetical protein
MSLSHPKSRNSELNLFPDINLTCTRHRTRVSHLDTGPGNWASNVDNIRSNCRQGTILFYRCQNTHRYSADNTRTIATKHSVAQQRRNN